MPVNSKSLKNAGQNQIYSVASTSIHYLVEQPASFYTKGCGHNASELLIKNTSAYTVEHDFFGTARWQTIFLVSHWGYMVTQCLLYISIPLSCHVLCMGPQG